VLDLDVLGLDAALEREVLDLEEELARGGVLGLEVDLEAELDRDWDAELDLDGAADLDEGLEAALERVRLDDCLDGAALLPLLLVERVVLERTGPEKIISNTEMVMIKYLDLFVFF